MSVNAQEETGIIARFKEQGAAVIYKFISALPDEKVRSKLTWLTVISWKYDGASNNSMPMNKENQNIVTLEVAIEDHIEKDGVLQHVYSRTGNNLKELVYYSHDQDRFLKVLNRVLASRSRYPIEINFYKLKFRSSK